MIKRYSSKAGSALFLLANSALAAPQDNQFLYQQEQQKALEQQLAPEKPDVRLPAPVNSISRPEFPEETPCFPLSRVVLSGTESLPHWLPLQRIANWGVGQCLGTKGINLLMSSLQNRLIYHGYVTTRVLAPAQDLKSGTLRLTVLPGTIRHVVLTPESGHYIQLYSAFPAHEGALLDLRDIEQGLENLQRLTGVEASMEIVPGDKPGESDIALSWKQDRMWRLGAYLDDSGTKSTGRYQGGMTVYLNNPLSLSDMFYVSGSHDLNSTGDKGNKNLTLNYSVPFGYWQFGVTANDYSYHQLLAGPNGDNRYSGKSKSLTAQASRIIHRSGTQKTTLNFDVTTRQSRNFINDTEIEVQRRQTSAWRLGLQHRHYIGAATLDAGASWQRGTRWFGAMKAPEEYTGDATALGKILRLDASLTLPFALASQNFRYSVQYSRQINETRLTPQDEFSIGNRWTVRGFDGERSLSAARGWFVRNDLGWSTPLPGSELYIGADYGEVGGSSSSMRIGDRLAGGALGLRGSAFNTGYDLFAGIPFSKPKGFQTSGVTLGFSLNWNY
ncbi:ShlB/FhaC/HecB family hemolysin secretion/activation protein [Erwinia sp. HR93]|uniref:ShlB/FhaC/HecB family hemolysin secretion/activation protein n=1 Tax=Erwinia sp. HR93 TaxID=3094840 RepID=UPI002ADEC9EC|nr:ShlB/FhaC/HecB family hemolysin secretion/activation protein [Erwinia sp. HR93]MEA1063083.1 ShlB/FhaC/HecB family hemolysin secretion/activation protein [Erwinia sp. HR93]